MTVTPLEQVNMLLTESQANLHDTIAICRQLLAEKAELIAWQQVAVETLARWERCADLVPSSRRIGRSPDFVFAYIDHLHEELAATRDEIRQLIAANHTLTTGDDEPVLRYVSVDQIRGVTA
jgi:hypothetical protein